MGNMTSREKLSLYHRATDKLAARLRTMEMPPEFSAKYNVTETLRNFRAVFLHPELRREVLLPQYEDERIASGNFSAGFCGVASYTWTHLFRMADGSELWQLQTSNIPVPHVWLKNKFTGEILDLTYDQFAAPYPYDIGRYAGSDFAFRRAYKFGRYLDIDVESIVIENALRSLGRRG